MAGRTTLAERLTYALRMRGMSARQLDSKIGANRWASRIARGETGNPEAPKLRAAAQALGVPRQWLETGEGESGLAPERQQPPGEPNADPRYDARDVLLCMLAGRADRRELEVLRSLVLREGDAGDPAWWRERYAQIRRDRIATDAMLEELDRSND